MTSQASTPAPSILYADGACSGNPGPGGWGARLELPDGAFREIHGGEADTTNNRMELLALIEGLSLVPEKGSVIARTDSQYAKNGITSWIKGWKKNGWKASSGSPVKNRDLWERLDAIASARKVSWEWVKGHAGNPGNERADALANLGLKNAR